MRRKILYLLCAALAAGGIEAAEFSVKSPDGKLEAKLEDGKQLAFSVTADGKKLLDRAAIGMSTDRGNSAKTPPPKAQKPEPWTRR